MRLGGPIAVVLIAYFVCSATSADAASCRAKKNHNCLAAPAVVDLSKVPEISREIVHQEPAAAKPKTNGVEAPPITTYTGPLIGVSSMAHVPTVGYYWSLEPDSQKQ
jgi:hypothetical protein